MGRTTTRTWTDSRPCIVNSPTNTPGLDRFPLCWRSGTDPWAVVIVVTAQWRWSYLAHANKILFTQPHVANQTSRLMTWMDVNPYGHQACQTLPGTGLFFVIHQHTHTHSGWRVVFLPLFCGAMPMSFVVNGFCSVTNGVPYVCLWDLEGEGGLQHKRCVTEDKS